MARTNQFRSPAILSEMEMDKPAIPALSVLFAKIAKTAAMIVITFPNSSNLSANHRFETDKP